MGVTTEFVNECGNAISLEVSRHRLEEDRAVAAVTYRLAGPTSQSVQTMTRKEAAILATLLAGACGMSVVDRPMTRRPRRRPF